MKDEKAYPIASECWRNLKSIKTPIEAKIGAATTGEIRPPAKGEWYISGALPEAYCASNNLTQSFHIAKIVLYKTRQVFDIVKELQT